MTEPDLVGLTTKLLSLMRESMKDLDLREFGMTGIKDLDVAILAFKPHDGRIVTGFVTTFQTTDQLAARMQQWIDTRPREHTERVM